MVFAKICAEILMTKKNKNQTLLDKYLGCFGNFNFQDPICKKFCALRLRCLIDRDQNNTLELIEDLMSSAGMSAKIQ